MQRHLKKPDDPRHVGWLAVRWDPVEQRYDVGAVVTGPNAYTFVITGASKGGEMHYRDDEWLERSLTRLIRRLFAETKDAEDSHRKGQPRLL